ncbi:MAG: hypothetical protein LCI02_19105 [Proteobacteria bacterium]|nr:hypothetical protein [Pseudomonadota bacterium]
MRHHRRFSPVWLQALGVVASLLAGLIVELFVGLFVGLMPTPVHAAEGPRITIVDGDALLVDGSRAWQAAEGLGLGPATLVHTAVGSRLLRVEWPDGTAADFGPDTQAMVAPPALGGRAKPAAVYLLRGWLKLSSLGSGPASMSPGATTPALELLAHQGAVVLMVAGGETWAFAESGRAPLQEREAASPARPVLKPGEVYRRDGQAAGAVAPRPTPAQMQRVPRGFRESLPLRRAAVAGRAVTPRAAPAPRYAELRDWLVATDPALRRPFARRFAARVREADFRSGLLADLPRHPEWEPLLFPERSPAKPATATR